MPRTLRTILAAPETLRTVVAFVEPDPGGDLNRVQVITVRGAVAVMSVTAYRATCRPAGGAFIDVAGAQ